MRPPTHRVVVLGGGFAGLYAASYLASADLPGGDIDVVLISDRNYFTFTPLLAEVVGGALSQEHVTLSYRILGRHRGFEFLLARVEGLDPDACVIHTDAGPVAYDHAVVAFGATPSYFGDEALRASSMPLTSVAHAIAIRNRVIGNAERAAQERNADRRRRLLTFVVAGAGPAGVEVASEIHHLISDVLPRYYPLQEEPRVVVINAVDRILAGWDADLAEAGLEKLRNRGIEVRLRTRVDAFDGRSVTLLRDGAEDRIEADTLIWAAGTAPASGPIRNSGLPVLESGHVAIDQRLRIRGYDNLLAVGDITRLVDPRTGSPYPPVAPIAISQGVRAAGNIENAIAGRDLEPYQAFHAGKIVSLGSGVALVDLLGFRLRGRPAWWIYRSAYILKMLGTKNKIRTATSLLLNHVFERDLTCTG